jgi:putative ABC transport system permease protein
MEAAWHQFSPEYPIEYEFLDARIDAQYRTEQRMGDLFKYFTILAMLISCLGLLGLASFAAEQRTKEIGIRKVLGATVANIIALITREFFILIAVASVIAWPIAWYAMSRWLQNFAFRTDMPWWTFIAGGGAALFVAIVTVIYQALKAATTDPVKSLRYE